jgi:hypothetical protein
VEDEAVRGLERIGAFRSRALNTPNPNHFPLRASTDYRELAAIAERCLGKLGFEFLQNRGRDLIEFEIVKPRYFRIVMERRRDPEVRNFLLPSIKAAKGAHVDLWLDMDQEEALKLEAFENAKTFFRSLVASMPVAPWEGLKFRESAAERKRWMDLTG